MKLELFFIFFILLLLPFGQLTRLPLNFREVNIYVHDILVIFLLLSWLIRKFFKKERFSWPALTKPILAFFMVAFFSWILAFSYYEIKEMLVGLFYLLRWIAYGGIYFVLVDLLKKEKNPKLNSKIYNLLIISGSSAAILGLLQYLFFPDIRALTLLGWDPHYYRLVGTYLDPSFMAMIYVLTLILLIVKLSSKNIDSLIAVSLFLLNYLALALTYSRSGYLAYISSLTLFCWIKKSFKFFLIIFVLAILTVILLPRPGGEGVKLERRSTILARLINWKHSWQIIQDYPLFGVGFNTYRYAQRDYGFLKKENWSETHAGAGADSSLLFVFATTGIIGFIDFIYLLTKMLVLSYGKKWWIFLSLMAVLIHSFFNNSLFYAWIMLWWWILVGISENIKEYS